MSELLMDIQASGIATLTLNRPEKRNALNASLISALNTALTELADNSSLRVLVLKSSGEHFSAGADLQWMKASLHYSHEQNLKEARALAELLHRLDTFPTPTMALVHGAAMGGAVGLISCCDLCLAQSTARFALSEVKLGLTPATISPYVIRAIGERQARRYMLTAEILDAQQALQLGLCHRLCEPDQLEDSAKAWLSTLLANGPAALSITKTLIRRVSTQPIDESLREETAALIADIRTTHEAQEGMQAFFDKRAPHWLHSDKEGSL
ncbi:enoyl-CoA hydratase-related protein [Pokkaliibacter sp. CJK22405]|uniref:enoyl-CoA hydratase-related protein n=1 Tax=Pokkaliibacter sp. CJK22405 TaxID=3384615 RepID=UPI003984D8B7